MNRDVGDSPLTFQLLNARNLLSTDVHYNYPVYLFKYFLSPTNANMLVCTVTDCVFNVSSVKNVDYGILSWTLYLNLMVHYH